MANQNLGRDVGGALANSLAQGRVYNSWRNTYAPGTVTGVRAALGVANQMGGPVGSLVGWLGNKLFTRNNAQAQAFDRQGFFDDMIGPQAWAQRQHLLTGLQQGGAPQNYSAPANSAFVGRIGMNPQINGGIAGLLQGGVQGGFQPSVRDWQSGVFSQNVQGAQNRMAGREAAAMQAIQNRINGVPIAGGHVGGRGSGQLSGGAKSNFGFGGWDSAEAREAAIEAVGDALRESRNGTPNSRQTGGNIRGHLYEN